MEHSTANRQSVPETKSPTETGGTKKAHGNRNFEQMILPSLGGTGPILPEWVRKRFRRKDTAASR
jgi:hypothetical protein